MRLEAAVGYEEANWRPGLVEFEGGRPAGFGAGIVRAATDDPRYVRALGSFGRALAFAGEAARAREVGADAIERARARRRRGGVRCTR